MKKTLATILSAFCLFITVSDGLAQGTATGSFAPIIQQQSEEFTLISRAAEPRQKLRYRFSGNAELITMELGMKMGIELAGRTIPKQKMPLFVQTLEVTPVSVIDGNMNYRYSVSKISVQPDAGVDPNLLKTLQETQPQSMAGNRMLLKKPK